MTVISQMTAADAAQRCRRLRRRILQAAVDAGGGHIAPAYSVLETLVALYFGVLRVDPNDVRWPGRDRCILSKGHGCLALYAVLAERGFFPAAWLDGFTKPGSVLGGHPDRKVPGVEASSGSLGHGLSVGLGMALAAKLDEAEYRAFVVMSDGECQEGSVWEAIMFAVHLRLDNLCVVVDHNKLQSLGRVADVMTSPTSLADKWRAFGWDVIETDGHDVIGLIDLINRIPAAPGRPTVVIAHTIKGKGISFMEGQPIWHYRVPAQTELERARRELADEPDE